MARLPLIAVLCLLPILGCGTKPFSAASNVRLTDEEHRTRRVLTRAEQAEALDALRSVAQGHQPGHMPQLPAEGMRWRDVPLAVRLACEEVDMALVRVLRESDDEVAFLLTTLDERPAELVVTRVAGPQVYVAAASVGRFADDPERAARLVEALRRNMLALGQKRSLD